MACLFLVPEGRLMAQTEPNDAIRWQVIIHSIFLVSAIMLAWTDKVMMSVVKNNGEKH